MSKKFNPFTEQIEIQYFVGREEQLERFKEDLDGLRQKVSNHQYIAGTNGTGKSSYLAKLSDVAKNQGFVPVLTSLDPADIPSRDMSRIHVTTIMRAIISQLQAQLGNSAPLVADWDSKTNSKYFQTPRTEEL